MITKELFISVMNTITEHRRTLEKIGQTLKESRSTLMVWDRDEGYLGALIQILVEVFNDDHEWIEWWLFEDVEKTSIIINGEEETTYDLTDVGAFYDFLIRNNDCSSVPEETVHVNLSVEEFARFKQACEQGGTTYELALTAFIKTVIGEGNA